MREWEKAQTSGILITLNQYASAPAKTPLKKSWTFAFMEAKEITISIWNPEGSTWNTIAGDHEKVELVNFFPEKYFQLSLIFFTWTIHGSLFLSKTTVKELCCG